jgi:hypothetical protein
MQFTQKTTLNFILSNKTNVDDNGKSFKCCRNSNLDSWFQQGLSVVVSEGMCSLSAYLNLTLNRNLNNHCYPSWNSHTTTLKFECCQTNNAGNPSYSPYFSKKLISLTLLSDFFYDPTLASWILLLVLDWKERSKIYIWTRNKTEPILMPVEWDYALEEIDLGVYLKIWRDTSL